jgi:hypothetical protein
MKIKKWLIHKLGGFTKQEYENAMKQNFIQELEVRVRNGKDIVIGVRNLAVFETARHMFSDKCEISRGKMTIKYNDLTFRIVNITNKKQLERLRGLNLNGFFFID